MDPRQPPSSPSGHRGFRSTRQFHLIDGSTLPGTIIGILIVVFVSSLLLCEVEHPVNAQVATFTDAFYFTMVVRTTVGFEDITPLSDGSKWLTILMILSGIILVPWQISRIVKEWIHFSRKCDIIRRYCGLR